MIYKIYDTENASPLFAGWEETLIWSCLDGLMGCIYGDHPLFPQSAVAVLGDFSFFAGKPAGNSCSWTIAGHILSWFPKTRSGRH